MNHHQRHLPPGVNRALRLLALLLCAVPPARAALTVPRLFRTKRPVASESPHGYLSAIGAPELRFQSAVVVATPSPAAKSVPAEAATSETPTDKSPSQSAENALGATTSVSAEAATAVATGEKHPTPKTKPASVIIRDDTRTAVRPEDFLPFFQFPAAGKEAGSLNLVVPVPGQPAQGSPLPASSATYTQTPK